ncbi:uncharacterized protein PFL1_02385 [Pseudozyma flocculosa PF-1]|uniref:LCCL domain-containing protein n=1 Tax=Pseudozyma flocculosa TaxID=84751 RepID=A0A5C3F8V5_9BASI|nr:uncharacterized protein PFL1_02385 [Pseudozyma flocculosa PF-1]EPQ30269.1 hypothetical protein PFL1_02385 [Pseudozyma flocculosa PF-1]SPO39791.1 uncharacterized protein PSFLO_05272 [Pseudozyma flocculosa]
MPAPLIPAERLRDALDVVRQSIEHFSTNYRTWLTQAPAYSTAPSLRPDRHHHHHHQHDDGPASPASGSATRRPAFHPDAETLARAYCPIAGPRWDEHRTRAFASTAIKGLTVLRNQIDAELLTLEKIAAENGNWQDPHPFSNGPHHIHYWEEILYVALTSGPVVSIQDRFSFDMDLAVRRKKRMQRSQAKAMNSQSCKVDIVSRGGDRWTRLYIVKFERLRAEFREAESYMVASDDDDDDDDGDDPGAGPAGANAQDGALDRGDGGAGNNDKVVGEKDGDDDGDDYDDDPAMDSAARNCSLMKTIRELRAAADTEAQARLQRSAESGRPDIFRPIEIELIITRIDIEPEPTTPLAKDASDTPFYQQDEASRFQARMRAILRAAKRMGVTIVTGFRRLPTETFGRFEYPSVFLQGSDLPVGLPQIPAPPPRPDWKTTRRINLDVTAAIALVSDTTHGIFDDEGVAGEGGPCSSSKRVRSLDADNEADPTFQRHFRTFSIRKEALEARAAELSLQDDKSEEAARAMDSAASKEGRALAIQLERELTLETLFDAILEPILGGGRGDSAGQPRKVELHATVGAFDRLRRVSSTVGGTNEKRRVAALLGDDGVPPDEFWRGSKWASPEHAQLRACLQLPVRPLSDLGPGGLDSIEELSQLYPDLARRHFVSHLLDTLESCLTELWGPEWRDISEDLPRSKYKRLKQHSVHQAGGQTYTTLRSMHACARYGMTTLTSNLESVQWLLKEMNRRPYSAKTQAILDQADAQDVGALFDPKATYEACFLLLHPRSLSEQMRMTSEAPPWREVLAGFPGGLGTPKSETPPDGIQEKSDSNPPNGHGQGQSQSEGFESVYGIELPTLSRAAPRDGASTSAAEGSRKHTDAASGGGDLGSKSFFDLAEPNESRHRGRPLPVRDKSGSMSTVSGDETTALAIGFGIGAGAAMGAGAPSPGTRKKGFGARAKDWIAGPRHPVAPRIRHYRWWPLGPLEHFWLKFTDPVAWKDPFAGQGYRRGYGSGYGDGDDDDGVSVALPGPRGPSTPDEPQARKGQPPRLGLAWFEPIRRDLSTNRIHWSVLCATYVAWILGFSFLTEGLWFNGSITGPDGIARDPTFFSCTTTYWLRNGGCGLDGQDCSPFSTPADSAGVAFRCPSGCSGVTLLNPRTVGDEQVNYVPLVVGGGDEAKTYRSDSFVCAAAIHAGVIRESEGGAGSVRLVGAWSGYANSTSNGIESVGFDGTFPSSFRFEATSEAVDCTDRRWRLYALDVVLSAFVGLVLRPKRMVWFWTLACLGFWHVNMASEPRDYPPPVGEAVGDLLPYLFGCYVIWRVAVRYVWPAFEGLPLEGGVGTLGLWWVGVLMNVVFAGVPLQRLTAHDIGQQPGAVTALVVIVVVVLALAVHQVLVIRRMGYLPKYLVLYLVGAALVGLAAAVPGETLRMHHYIIALVLVPACAFPTRLSLLATAFLLGMYTNGIARWGFDGLLQDVATVRGDATGGTGQPRFLTNSTGWPRAGGVVEWAGLEGDEERGQWSGFNLLVDDVLRYQGAGTTFNLSSLPDLFAQQRRREGQEGDDDAGLGAGSAPTASLNATLREGRHYLRLAFTAADGTAGDYTRAATATLADEAAWSDPQPGAT